MNEKLDAFLLEDVGQEGPGRFAIAFWSNSGILRARLTLPTGVRGYNIMGHPLPGPGQPFLLSKDVIYVLGPEPMLNKAMKAIADIDVKPVVLARTWVKVDPRSGQYVYHVKVKNLLVNHPIRVRVLAHRRRNFLCRTGTN